MQQKPRSKKPSSSDQNKPADYHYACVLGCHNFKFPTQKQWQEHEETRHQVQYHCECGYIFFTWAVYYAHCNGSGCQKAVNPRQQESLQRAWILEDPNHNPVGKSEREGWIRPPLREEDEAVTAGERPWRIPGEGNPLWIIQKKPDEVLLEKQGASSGPPANY